MCQPKPKPKSKEIIWGNKEVIFSIILTPAPSPVCSFLFIPQLQVIVAPWFLCLQHKYPHGNPLLPLSLSFLNAFRKGISSSLTFCLWVPLFCAPVVSCLGSLVGFALWFVGCHPPLTSTAPLGSKWGLG